MGRITVSGKAHDFAVDSGSARFGMLQLFEYQGARAFPNHQTIALRIKWRRGGFGFIVTLAGGKQRVKHRRFRRAQLLSAPRNHNGLIAVANRLPGVANCLAAGRTGA